MYQLDVKSCWKSGLMTWKIEDIKRTHSLSTRVGAWCNEYICSTTGERFSGKRASWWLRERSLDIRALESTYCDWKIWSNDVRRESSSIQQGSRLNENDRSLYGWESGMTEKLFEIDDARTVLFLYWRSRRDKQASTEMWPFFCDVWNDCCEQKMTDILRIYVILDSRKKIFSVRLLNRYYRNYAYGGGVVLLYMDYRSSSILQLFIAYV
jgi:hypothetical protein